VSPLTDVDKSLPPTIVSVSLLLSATAVPELEATFLKIFCDEPLYVFVYVTAKPDTLSLNPLPALNVKLSPAPKSLPST